VYYKGFPKAFGMGKTEEEAELNLLQIFITLLKERKGGKNKGAIT